MRVFAVIVGVLALLIGGSTLVQANGWISWPAVFIGWLPFFGGWGLASYALLTRKTPFPAAAKAVTWLLVAGFIGLAGIVWHHISLIN